jgi:exodeoxyribonuclease V gamma subunit
MLSIAFSNRYEVLLETLLAHLAAERPGPFGVREVIVPSSALRRSVELAVADREGIAANLRFSYLAQWLWGQIGKVVAVGEESPFAPPLLAWRVFALFGEAHWSGAHPRLAGYLAGADAPMRFELATRVARLFDNYLTYRPQWLAAWSAGHAIPGLDDGARADEAWQAALWRRITAALGTHPEHPASAFFRAVEGAGAAAVPGLPASVQVFCLPTLPPLYLDLLRQLARWVEVRLYVLNPCREYWFEVVDPRRLAWLASRQQALFHEVGNRLLAGWGRQTQAHVDLLFEGEGGPLVEESLFVPAAGTSLLARLQNAVLELIDPAPGSLALAADDRSIEVHVCHSLTRELEVLHDRLLELLAGENAPRPHEILVVTPDLEAAAPLIDAVFGTAPPARRIPFVITGLGHTRVNPVARVLSDALALAAGRFPASGVFELLQQAPVAERFGLAGGELERVHEWLRDAGVRWGLDAAHRGRLGLPESERHSLAGGLDRLFLAWAWGEDSEACFAGRIGAGNPEGGDALALGRLWRYAETLRALEAACARAHDADGWRALFFELLDRLVPATAEWADDLRSVQATLAELHAHMAAGGAGLAIAPAVAQAALTALFDDPARGGVPGGAVTFSAMSSLRALPYRVVCAIGLDDGAFPSADRPAEFDLMAQRPARGDRQRRHDERNVFLDLVLAARERLHLSYAGRSQRDNSEKPPSVLVDELLDYAARATARDAHDPRSVAEARAGLRVVHPLQAFSSEYFDPASRPDARLASFNSDWCEALRARLQAAADAALPTRAARAAFEEEGEGEEEEGTDEAARGPFFAAPLPPPAPEWRRVELAQLIRFFRHPARFLLQQRLGVRLPEGDEELQDDEPFLPDFGGRQALAERLLPLLMEGVDEAALADLAAAGGEYPAGALGTRMLERETAVLQAYAGGLRAALAPPPLPPLQHTLQFDLDGETWTLEAAFGDLRPAGLVRHRYDDVRGVDYLAGWITHLALCAAAPAGVECVTAWHSRDGVFRLRPCAEARERLAGLVALYRAGLTRPLHFFPKSAWSFIANGASSYTAQQRWSGGGRPEFGERNDAAIRLVFRGLPDPLDADFYDIAAQVLGPVTDHLDDPRL